MSDDEENTEEDVDLSTAPPKGGLGKRLRKSAGRPSLEIQQVPRGPRRDSDIPPRDVLRYYVPFAPRSLKERQSRSGTLKLTRSVIEKTWLETINTMDIAISTNYCDAMFRRDLNTRCHLIEDFRADYRTISDDESDADSDCETDGSTDADTGRVEDVAGSIEEQDVKHDKAAYLYPRGLDDDLLSRTATDLSDNWLAPGKFGAFKCPVPSCGARVHRGARVWKFYMHVEDTIHTSHFFHNGYVPCRFGFERGFIDVFSEFRHYISKSCCAAANLRTGRLRITYSLDV